MAKKPVPEITEERERRCWELRMQGHTEMRIAEELGVTQSAVCLMLQRVRTRLVAAFEGQAAEMRAEQTEQLQEILAKALAAFEKSQQDAETRVIRTTRGRGHTRRNEETQLAIALSEEEAPCPEAVVEERTRKGQSGNAALLKAALQALGDLRALWGLEAPKKADVTSGGQPVKWYTFDSEKM